MLFAATTAQAKVVWRGEFENGTRSEFSRYHAVEASPPRIDVINKPVADGRNTKGAKAARVEVKTGDDARKLDPATGRKIGDNVYRERAELMVPSNLLGRHYFREGDDIWVAWQAMFPSDKWWGKDPKGGGTIVFQFHHVKMSTDTYDGSPPVMLTADNDSLYFTQCLAFLCPKTVTHFSAPIRFDHWYTFVVRAKHSTKAANGQLEFWVDGERVVNTNTALLFGSDFGNYILTGQYRRPNTARNSVYYVDNYVIGTTKEDVMPTPPPPPPPVKPPVDSVDPVVPVEPPEPQQPEPQEPEPQEPEPQQPEEPDPQQPEPEDPEPQLPEPQEPEPQLPEPGYPTDDDRDPVEDPNPVDTSNPGGYSPLPEDREFDDEVMFLPGTAGCSHAGGTWLMLLGLAGLAGRVNGSSRLRRNNQANRPESG